MRIIRYLLLILIALALFSCSSSKSYYDDGVRIKQDKHEDKKYTTVPGTDKKRSSATLRGTVYGVETIYTTCEDSVTGSHTFVIFKDSTNNALPERIPIDDVILIGLDEKVGLDTNFFEYYNDPLDPRAIREVPHRYSYRDTCDLPCECQDLSIGLKCPTAYKCRDSVVKKRWYFMEYKAGYAIYNDREPGSIIDVAREGYFAEMATGFRFGNRHQYGLGLLFSTGVPLYNSRDLPDIIEAEIPNSIYRPFVMLHNRYQFESIFCVRPFVYGNFGIAIDDLTLDLACMNLSDCQECKELALECDCLDLSMPLSYGLGAGVDIPITCNFDLSFDFGWRSVAFGEISPSSAFGLNVPSKRRVNMFIFRLGVTL